VARLTQARVGLVIRAELRGERTVVAGLAGTEPWHPRILVSDGPLARVVLVQSRASLLCGDDVGLRIDLGPGAALEIVELGATIANNVRGGSPARLEVVVDVAQRARLVWLARPVIASAGCWLQRSTRVAVAGDGRALLGESIVLGRHGEQPGRVDSHTRITLDGRPVVDETFTTAPAWLLHSSVVAGDAAMVEGLTLVGLRDQDPESGAFQAHEEATLWRSLGRARAELHGAGTLAARWRALALDRIG
jgi:urease accessory protein